ncbi:MAG: hypothetical protein ACFFCM_00425 [Promethearchaeota archaeon]
MFRKAKFSIIIGIILPFFLLFCNIGAISPYFSFPLQIDNKTDLKSLSFERDNYTGSYEGNVSLMYTRWGGTWSYWLGGNYMDYIIDPNKTINNYVYDLNYIDIYVYGLIDNTGSYNYIIEDNLTAESNVTNSFSFAQEFISPDLLSIKEILLYFNYTLPVSILHRFELTIYDETFQDVIDYNETWENRQDVAEWYSFRFFNNILEAGKKYNLVLSIWFDTSPNYRLTNVWKTANHSTSVDEGISKIYDGNNWNPLLNDNETDFLCNFNYIRLVDPAKIDLKYIIDEQIYIPNYRKGLYSRGYEAFYSYNFVTPPTDIINVTAVANQSVNFAVVDIYPRYVYLINITGIFNTSGNQINWHLQYPYRDISLDQTLDFFMFENDWTLDHFYNPNNEEFEDLFFGAIKLWNTTYNGIIDIWGFPLEQDIYSGIYHSSNYFNKFYTKLKIANGSYKDVPSFQIGQTIRLEAELMDSNNQPISGGTGHIELISQSGMTIYNGTSLSSNNGIINSTDISLSNLGSGIYTINFFWTNGRKVAYYSTVIEIRKEPQLPILIPPNEMSVEILILIIALLAAAVATPTALVVRRQLQSRNWEKSCRYLFILAKNGVSMYSHSFGIEFQDPILISGMISAINSFIKEVTGSKKLLRTIDQEDKKILISHKEYTISALVADKAVSVMYKNLENFHSDFQKTFKSLLKDWNGDTAIFKGTEKIIDRYFPVDMEDKIIRGVKSKIIEFTERITTVTEPADVISIFREITEFSAKYQVIINTHYSKQYNELIKIAEEKINT